MDTVPSPQGGKGHILQGFLKYLGRQHLALLALFVALGGVSYAAVKLPAHSVGTRQLKANSVIGSKVKNGSLTGADVNASSLGKVPSAANADSAASATNASHATSANSATSATRATNATHAANSDKLGGISAAGFYAAGSQVADSNLLDGIDSTGFYAAGSTVADSAKLGGIDASGFLRNTAGSVTTGNLVGGAVTNAKVANDVIRHVAYNQARSTGGNPAYWNFGPIQLYATCYTGFGLSVGSSNLSSSLGMSENMSWITTANAAYGKRLALPANTSASPLLQTGTGGGAGTGTLVDWNSLQTVGGTFTYFADSTHCEFYGVVTQATNAQN